MRIEEKTYTNRDNAIVFSLSSDGAVITHTGITRCQVLVGTTMLDSAVTPGLFDLTQADRISFYLGTAGIAPGSYLATLYVFDVNNTRGIRWDEFDLIVSS